MTDKNMELWDKVCVTDKSHTTDVNYGKRHFTAIDAQYQIRTATELWGPFGMEWGVKSETFSILGEEIIYQALLWYPGGVVELHSSSKQVDDWAKKLATDALTKSLSKLGFNADVFLGQFDGNKYTPPSSERPAKPPAQGKEVSSERPAKPERAAQSAEQKEKRKELMERGNAAIKAIRVMTHSFSVESLIADASHISKGDKSYHKTALEEIPPTFKNGGNTWLETTVKALEQRMEDIKDGTSPPF